MEPRNVTYWRTAMHYVLANARSEPVAVDDSQTGLGDRWEDTIGARRYAPTLSGTWQHVIAKADACRRPVEANLQVGMRVGRKRLPNEKRLFRE